MSDSTRAKSRRSRKQGSGRFVAMSLAMHLGGLGLLMLYTPARQAVFGRPEEPEIRLEGDALAELTEQIRDINREQLMASIMELSAIHEEMEDMRVDKVQEFNDAAAGQVDEQFAKLQTVLAEVTAAQNGALDQQRQAGDKSSDKDGVRAGAAQQQSSAETGQQSLTDILEYAQAAEVLKTKQDAANAAQIEATRALATVRQSASSARGADDELKRVQEEATRLQESLKNEQKTAEETKARLTEAQQVVTTTTAKETEKQEALKTAQATPKPADKNAARARDEQINRAKDEARKAGDELRKVQQQQKNAEGEVRKREAQVASVETKLKAALETVEKAKETIATRDQEFVAKQAEAVKLQEKANELQQVSTDTVNKALASGMKPGQPQTAQRRSLDALRLYDASIGEMYEYLVEAEKEIGQSYSEFRATDLAMLTGTTPKRAMQQIDVPQPNRPKIDVEITKEKIVEGEQYRRHAEAVQVAVRESESIVTATQNLLDSARRTGARGGDGAGVDLSIRARRLAEINAASHEEQGGQVSDLTELMRQAGGGSGGDDQKQPPPTTPRPRARSMTAPQVRDVDVTAPARTVVTGAPGAKWTFVDSWYTIGPFANPGRANIHRVFPPESSVNLDAVYEGMFGPIKWQFIQSPRPMVVPANAVEYGIWYAYTELAFEEECDLWIAVGSDDRSDIWINDVRVWSSSDALKGWQIGEGLRRVHFAKGRNRVLYRIENGWHTIGFSMCLFMGGE